MSNVKGCDRCKYNKIEYEIDYKKSAQEQKIYYKEIRICSKCNYINPKSKYKEAELDNYPNDMKIDLSKIIHDHNHNKYDYEDGTINYRDDKGNCIKTHSIIHYKCDFCDKKSDYTYTYDCEHIFNYKYVIDYNLSAQDQKIRYQYSQTCNKCKYSEYHTAFISAELDDYPSDMKVDLSKIIHEHNHNKLHYVEEEPTYDKRGNCIKLVLINHYMCDFCGKLSDYTDIKNRYDLNNPCDRMKKLTKHEKERIRHKKIVEDSLNCVWQ